MTFLKRSLEDWLEYIQTVHFRSIDLSLERVNHVYQRLCADNAFPNTTIITIGGTNGKGSSVALLESIYRHAGFTTATYTSPHLISYNERIKVNNLGVSNTLICDAFERIDVARKDTPLTYFEFSTLAALLIFEDAAPDVMILETGMGGRQDAVNIIKPNLVLITNVSLDHTQWLGDTREKIAYEKAGLFKSGVPIVINDHDPLQNMMQLAKENHSELMVLNQNYDFQWDAQLTNESQLDSPIGHWAFSVNGKAIYSSLPPSNLKGRHQYQNAAGVLAAVHLLQAVMKVDEQSIIDALKSVFLEGRLQIIEHQQKQVILDVAHNTDGVLQIVKYVRSLQGEGKITVILGMLADKQINESLIELMSLVDDWCLATLEVDRGSSAEDLAVKLLKLDPNMKYNTYRSPVLAFNAAMQGNNKQLLVMGSFHTVGEILETIR